MNTKGAFILAALLMITLMLANCNHNMLNKNWGSASESAKTGQTAHPDASKNLDPVVSLDGIAAEKAMEVYQKGGGGEKDTTYNLQLGNIESIGEKNK